MNNLFMVTVVNPDLHDVNLGIALAIFAYTISLGMGLLFRKRGDTPGDDSGTN